MARVFFGIFHALSFELNFFRPEVPFNKSFLYTYPNTIGQYKMKLYCVIALSTVLQRWPVNMQVCTPIYYIVTHPAL